MQIVLLTYLKIYVSPKTSVLFDQFQVHIEFLQKPHIECQEFSE